jgi:hypothetical protein
MKLIRPIDITPAMLTACNVPETDQPAWNSGTTYLVSDGTTYKVLYNHKIYSSLRAANLNKQPDLNTTGATPYWLDEGYDNRWKMFDSLVGSQTSQATNITLSIVPGTGNNYDSIAILDVQAATITVAIPSTGFSDTFDMVTGSHINDAYTYFFNPIILTDTLCLVGMTPTSGQVDITISYPAGTAKVGTLVLGYAEELGGTKYNPTISITDYSQKTTDVFGNTTVTQRGYAKRMSCELMVENTAVDALQRTLANYRTTPVVWIGADALFSAMIIYGFYKSFQITIPYPNNSTCNIEVEGLA